MQARRNVTSSPALPSSPPSASLQHGDGSPLAEARGVPSPAQTLWTAHPSPTQTLGHSSPELPPLPTLAALGGFPRTPATVERHQPTDSTYYTASWGSPYQRPPPSFGADRRGHRTLSSAFGSDDLDEDTSNIEFGLEHLLPSRLTEDDSPNRFGLQHLLPSRLPVNAAETPTKSNYTPAQALSEVGPRTIDFSALGQNPEALLTDPSGKWVEQFLEGHWNKEAGNWWSDGSDNESTAQNLDEQKEPAEGTENSQAQKKGHKSRKDNLTLKQQDFWAHFSKDDKELLGKMMASRYADPSHSRQGSGTSFQSQPLPSPASAEKPLPLPPRDDRAPESPISPVALAKAAEVIPTTLPPRQRKRVPWKGKACWISIPRDIPRGTLGYPPKPLSAKEVDARLQQFERVGYDTRGFGFWKDDAIPVEHLAQNRAIHPDVNDWRVDRLHGPLKVRIPNKQEWDDYVNYLTEQKLAALGVSLGGEEDPPQMSRQASSQYPPLPFSPPLPTSSAGSQRLGRQGSIVSGPFPHGPSPGHASRQSIASPMSAFANARPSMHLHRHSTFGTPSSFAQQQTTTPGGGNWSPGQYFGNQGPRGGSPALPLSRPDLNDVVSPGSPFGFKQNQQFQLPSAHKDDLLAQRQQQQQLLQTQLLQQQQQQLLNVRPSSTLAEVPEDEAEEGEIVETKRAMKHAPEIAIPTPRGHRHNISENLEREALDAEYHLEQSIDKQFDEGGEFNTEPDMMQQIKSPNPATASGWEPQRPMQQILHQPQPHNRAHSLTKLQRPMSLGYGSQQTESQNDDLSDGVKTNVSDFTNPSMVDDDVGLVATSSTQHSKTTSQASINWRDSRPSFGHSKHTSTSSVSKMNVQAKEFKFNPAASFSPGSFSFSSGFNFEPSAAKSEAPSAPRSSQASFDGSSSGLKVSAPVFKPDAPAFKPVGMNGSTFPSSSFDFLSKGPSFKPDAPAFNPSSAPVPNQAPITTPNFSTKLFGNININANDIVKPAKRSKAIPIIRPDNIVRKSVEPEEKEDEAGRPMQADGREKRARVGRADGDSVPQFAQPSKPLGETTEFLAAKQDPQAGRAPVQEDKENLSPNLERAPSKSKSPDPLSTFALPKEVDSQESTVETPHTEISTGSLSDRTPTEDLASRDQEDVTPSVEEGPRPFMPKHKSSLSATAKPFEFRPSGFDFGVHVTKASGQSDLDSAHVSPPRHVSRSPATTFRPSDDGSYKTALDRRAPYARSESIDFDQYPQASFKEIDDVMKHLNDGSDFGVERDEPSWEQSSPHRSVHDFERNDLRPIPNLRSDAPSPSPGRLYTTAPRALDASTTSITDPFADERAGLAYESPVHRLNNADDLPVSDWDEGLSSEGEDKIQTRSRFFDSHVDGLIGRLLQNRLGPLEKNLDIIQNAIASISQNGGRGRRSMSNDRLDSDADDEDDEIGTDFHYRNRSPRKDRKLEKIRAIVRDALEAHQPQITSLPVPVPVPETALPEKVRDIVVEALASHQSQLSQASSTEPGLPEQLRSIVQEALAAQQSAIPPVPVAEGMQPEALRAIFLDALASHQPKTETGPVSESLQPETIRSIITEALSSHQSIASVSSLQRDDIRSVVMDALASHQPQPQSIPEIVQPDAIRTIVAEALESQKPGSMQPLGSDAGQPQVDLSEFYQVLGNLKATIAQSASSHVQPEDFREMIEEALSRQSTEIQRRSAEIEQRRESQVTEEKDMRIMDLESMIKQATLRFDEEAEARKAIEEREGKTQRLLKVTEEELALLKESANDDENKLRALDEECQDALAQLTSSQHAEQELRASLVSSVAENDDLKARIVALEHSESDQKKKLSAITAENEALQFTLEEYRLSSSKWRGEVQEANAEKESLKKAIDASKVQAEEARRIREVMRSRLEKLQKDMTVATGQVTTERAQWQKNDEEHMKKYVILSARIEAEGRTRERIERELERLEMQEREGMKLKVALEQTQKANARLEEVANALKLECAEHQKTAEKYERDYQEAREAARIEVRRTRTLLEADIDAANNQVNIVRAETESEVARVRAEIDNVRMDADTAKARHELQLEEAADARKQALGEALEGRTLALQEQQQAFDRRLESLSQEHERSLEIIREDKERLEAYHNDRLALADSKLEHLKDKVAHLEEKLSVAKEAAHAAAQSAQSAKAPNQATATARGLPEKISPQALRESIAVLQEQLQERESRIESLEHKLSEIDTDAPAKLRERDTEIGWLRELLGVRIDDINDLINALAQPSFDRETVRDAAIRIRTNLQMEQQEKERLMSGGQGFPTLASLSNFASPKAVQLAAAFGNWRKGRDQTSSSLAGGSSSNSPRTQTPSRTAPTSASAQSFLSGLMTPPTSNLRRTPQAPSSGIRPLGARSNSSSSNASIAGFPGLGKQVIHAAPSTPPLLRKAAYDRDAEDGRYGDSGFYDDDSTVDEDGETTPVGLGFGGNLRR